MNMFISVSLVVLHLLMPSLTQAADHTNHSGSTNADVAARVEQTFNGLFHYYWKNDPKSKEIQFFFACGQIGGAGNQNDGQCSCDHPAWCTNCYRWWDAIAMESVASYGIYMKTNNHSDIGDAMFVHSPYNANFNATALCTYVDDFVWYAMAYLRFYEWLGETKWLNRSLELHDWIWKYGWQEPCGGAVWMSCGSEMYKDSVTMVELLHLSSKLAYMFPNQSQYLERALRVWNWFFSFDDGYGLMSDKYLVSTGAVPVGCCNYTTTDWYTKCHNSRVSGTSYNQGVLMSASAYLYRRTGNKTYLNVGLRAVDAILTNYTTKEGILIDEPRGYQTYQDSCAYNQDPGGDWYSFNGIFMAHLSYFTELLHVNGSLPNATFDAIMSLVEKTSDAAWNRSAVWPPFKVKDVCNIGVSPPTASANYPKFHWWWGQSVHLSEQIIPPDPRYFFINAQLHCRAVGTTDTQLWKGKLDYEYICKQKCQENPQCSKYLYNQASEGINCWNWSYNRSDHSCDQVQYDFTVGVKRPFGSATCAGKCDSEEPQLLEHGGVCYCDSDCTKHLDCCLDYADHCTGYENITCKGMCDKMESQAIPGGGYCWCYSGCRAFETDNNTDGSCCLDHPVQCLGAPQEPVCLDVRSQGSALNLFLAHLKLLQLG